MSVAFVVMQIGDPQLDQLYETVIQPVIKSVGLEAKRVDRDNEGGLLKSEVIQFLNNSEIIIADLTNERPNVYLEVGYAMGVDKFRNLILTCRSDHLPGNDGWRPEGPKIHFDLSGYDILLWEPSNPDSLCQKLTDRIRRRRALLSPPAETERQILDMEWIQTHRETASQQMEEAGIMTYMEASFGVATPKPDHSPASLLSAASDSMIRTFGWPIGVVLENREEYRPQPRSDGIVAEVNLVSEASLDASYDYWALRRNGDFYIRKSLFENKRDPRTIFFNTRIVRNAELLLYALRLCDRLGIDPSSELALELTYGGLEGRVLRSSSPNRVLSGTYTCTEDRVTTSYDGSLQEVEANLTEVVKHLTAPMLALFDFFELNDSVYQKIVEDYVDGRVT